jgi:diguanylate cyclase (GGDEF)-like protein
VAAVAAAGRPLVLFVDDLQWAGATAVAVIDAIVTERPPGVLVVGAYRDAEVDALHPLTASLSRWDRSGTPPATLRLSNLPPADIQALLADMLRLNRDDAAQLAEVVGARAHGNPFDTVALVNALRRDDALTPTAEGWAWDATTIRRYIGSGDVIDLLTARIGDLPAPSRALLEAVACLGDRTELGLLVTATGLSVAQVEERLTPALEDGLLVLETAGTEHVATFRHDRVRQAAYAVRGDTDRAILCRDLARRLAGHPELSLLAAAQYLAAADELDDPAERFAAAGLLRAAAAEARLTDPALAERYLDAATALLGRNDPASGGVAGDPARVAAALAAARIEHHAVLCGLGRFAEADEVYAEIERRDPGPLELAEVSQARITGLRARNRQPEALALGLDILGRLGIAVPGEETLFPEIDRGIEALAHWVASGVPADDLRRPEVTDPAVLAAARVAEQILPVAYFSGQPVFAWLVALAQRMWAEHGPCAELVAPLSHAGFMTIMLRQDYRTGYEATRRVLAVSEARGYEPHTSHARLLFSLGHGPWFEPVPAQLEVARLAREGLQFHGDPVTCFTYFSSLPLFLDCAPTLEAFNAEAEAALAAARRIGDTHTAAAYLGYRQLARALRGATAAPGSLSDPSVDFAAHIADLAANPTGAANAHTVCAVAAAVFDDADALTAHATAAFPLLPFINATYLTATTYLVRALALVEQLRAAAPDQRAEVRDALDACRDWLAARAADAPENFTHLVDLLDAELCRADGDTWAAAARFDAAMREAARRHRTWHHGLIAERTGRFYLGRGLEHVGLAALAEARDSYEEWGAAGKVAQMDHAYPDLAGFTRERTGVRTPTTANVTSGAIDIVAVLEASRALSSATSLDALRTRLAEVLGAMTGATDIRLLTWDAGAGEWALRSAGELEEQPLLLGDPAAEGRVPLSVIRHVQRTAEPLLVADATADARFARDPYLEGLDGCSIMAVPIHSRGAPRALLLLEKRQARGAFTADRLDTVTLVAGQLAVSIENAVVYASLERKVSQRTQALATANERLEQLNRTDALTGLASRRRMEDVLTGEWARSLVAGAPIAAVMVDIDHFKRYNDHYGHLGGDQCLRRVAEALSSSIRDTDLIARYGGEEFCVILPGADRVAAVRIAERARLTVAALQAEHVNAPTGFVTVSLGLASVVPAAEYSTEDLVRWADEALYEAKRNGRNRIGVHPASR